MGSSNSNRIEDWIPKLRRDYEATVGELDGIFHCPILFEDIQDRRELCWGHVVPESLGGKTLGVPQTAKVDNFFGAVFEGECNRFARAKLNHRVDILRDPELFKGVNPKVLVDGEERIPIPLRRIPERPPGTNLFIEIESDDQAPKLFGLKGECDFQWSSDENIPKFEIAIEVDGRVGHSGMAFHSAHLTLFRLLGYSYACGTGGTYFGKDILGAFYRDCDGNHRVGKQRSRQFLIENASLWRPVVKLGDSLGTVEDNRMLFLVDSKGATWAFGVIVQPITGRILVVVPTMHTADAVAVGLDFIKSPFKTIAFRDAFFNCEKQSFEVSKQIYQTSWPEIDIA